MKIGNTAGSPNIAQVGQTGARGATDSARGSAAAPAGKAGEASATVQLSSTAQALLDGAEGGFDANKVEKVKQSIADGTYKVNAEAIADKLIANAQEVLGKVGGH